MALILPHTIINGENADATEVQGNFDAIKVYVDSNIILANGSVEMAAPLLLVGDPISGASDRVAANKGYVDAKATALTSAKVAKTGDTMTGDLVMGGNQVTSTSNPVNLNDLARKGYVDIRDDLRVAVAGDTMTGLLTANGGVALPVGEPSGAGRAARKDYVDTRDDLRVAIAGDTMTGDLVMGGNQVTSTANPINLNDLARKGYVDIRDDLRVAVAGDRMTGDLDLGTGDAYNTAVGVHLDVDGHVFARCDTDSVGSMSLTRSGSTGAQDVGQAYVYFRRGTVVIGQIIISDSTHVAYATSSDYRIKDDLGPIDDPLGVINALQPKHLRYKDSGYEFDGFIAHEVQAVVPLAVVGERDAVYPDDHPMFPGEDNLQQLDVSALVPYLVGAIQVLSDRITTLEDA